MNSSHSHAKRAVAFWGIFLVLFFFLQTVFLDKSSYAKWKNYNQCEKTDILILGNSHADSAIYPGYISESLRNESIDCNCFNYALNGMRIEQMYYFAKELLKIHTPKLIIVETYAFCPIADEHREILARWAFDTLPLSANKIEGIRYCVKDNYWSYYIPFIKYHSRWKDLTAYDVQVIFDKGLWRSAGVKGALAFDHSQALVCEDPGDRYFSQDLSEIHELRALTDSETECLEKLIDLLEEKDISLLFVSVPFKIQMGLNSVEQVKINNYLRENYVNGSSVQMLDMNRMWEELDIGYRDLENEGHMNSIGAEKATKCLLQYLKENYDLTEIL